MYATYIVKSGDTLYGISNQFGVSVTDIINLNNVDPKNLKIGLELKIPNKSGTNPNASFTYTVKKGDSLYSIAKQYNTTVNSIINLNNLKSTSLSIGQNLIIPEIYSNEEMKMPNYINYIVQKGDSLYQIAKKYNVSVATIQKDNSLTSNILQIGQNLKIRISESTNIEVEECFGEEYIPDEVNNYINYTVKKGDSLYKIASSYNTSVSEITNLNNLKSTNLSIGQVLKIPINSPSSTSITYTVKKGDSLYQIAKKYNTSVDAIKSKNNLKTNTLAIGQVLKI